MSDLNRHQTTAQAVVSAQQDPLLPLLTMIDETKVRQLFEASMREDGVTNFQRTPLGRYDNMVLEWTWLGWRIAVRTGAAS